MRRYRTGTQWCIWRWSVAPFLTRLHIVKTPWFAICLHWIHKADAEPWEHDHPVSFLSIFLRGRYAEIRDGELKIRKRLNFVKATDTHRILAVGRGVLTLCFMGPKVREWGYHTPDGWIYWRDYQREKVA
jgi:hypothetical protein